ncbi:hypothetical protein EDD17DRAFT_1629714 [Pisolithus thermaeus]|nr:hypothetical protein EDD17DRAFT_1629714 [Pisolithus thermaeus]
MEHGMCFPYRNRAKIMILYRRTGHAGCERLTSAPRAQIQRQFESAGSRTRNSKEGGNMRVKWEGIRGPYRVSFVLLLAFLVISQCSGTPRSRRWSNGRECDVVPFVQQASKFAAAARPSVLIPYPKTLPFYGLAFLVQVTHLSNLGVHALYTSRDIKGLLYLV